MSLGLECFSGGYTQPRSQVIMQHFLQNGELLAISPGGVREALFSDEYYTMIWNGRRGFAKVALEAQVVSDCILRNCSRNLLFVNLPKI